MNNSTLHVEPYVPVTSTLLYVIGVIYCVTITIGIVANILTVSTIMKTKYLRTPMNVSLVSLACSDIVVCVLVLPLRLVIYSNMYSNNHLFFLCKIDIFLKSVCDYVQPSMLVATSFERYKSIANPFGSKGKMKRIVIVIIATWCTCMSCGVVSAVLFEDGATLHPCNMEYRHAHLDIWYFREGVVTFPVGVCCLTLVGSFYFCMLRTLKNHGNKMSKRTKNFKNKVHPASTGKPVKDNMLQKPTGSRSHRTPGTTASITTHTDKRSINNTTNNTGINTTGCATNSTADNTTNTAFHRQLSTPTMATNCTSETRQSSTEAVCTSLATSDNSNIEIHAYTRNISVRKTRDLVYLTPNGNLRLPSFVKHVMTIKRHKRKSLERWKTRQVKAAEDFHCVSTNNHVISSDSCIEAPKLKSREQTGSDKIKALSTDVRKGSVSEFQSNKLVTLEVNTDKAHVTTNDDNADMEKTKSLGIPLNRKQDMDPGNTANVEDGTPMGLLTKQISTSLPSLNVLHITESCSESENRDTLPDKIDADHDNVAEDNLVSEPRTRQIIDTNNEFSVMDSGNKIITNENESNVKETTTKGADMDQFETIGDNKMTISVVQFNNDADSVKLGPNNDKDATTGDVGKTNELSERKPERKSHVDIVDFDGTVHKEVVEGSVVGAVCVMNKTNKLEGRRKVEIRAAKRIAAMIGTFMLLWLPLPLIVLLVSSRQQISSKDIEALLISASISAMTVAVNPMLNILLNKQLRSASISTVKRSMNSFKRSWLQ